MNSLTKSFCACDAAFFVNDDKHMDEFKADPIGIIRYMIQMENHPNGQQMAQLVHDHLFTLQKPYEDQKQQIELVSLFSFLFKIGSTANRSPPFSYDCVMSLSFNRSLQIMDFSNAPMTQSPYSAILIVNPLITISTHTGVNFRFPRWSEFHLKSI